MTTTPETPDTSAEDRATAVGLIFHALYKAGYTPQQAADVTKAVGITAEDMEAAWGTFLQLMNGRG